MPLHPLEAETIRRLQAMGADMGLYTAPSGEEGEEEIEEDEE